MGALTDVFVASSEELRATFPGRVPVKPEPITRITKNPFTGKPMAAKEWVPAELFPENHCEWVWSQHEREGVRRLPHREYKGLDWLMLAELWTQLRGGDWQTHLDALTRPALLAPGDQEDWVNRVPDDLVSALAALLEVQIMEVADSWSRCEVFQASNWSPTDASEVLVALCELAKTASDSQRGLYLWVCM